ncbi:MAG: glutamate 5-kinase [Clostridia bacterium]|nr:glutamate 5-kinase [Clostridia bacterium]MBQ1436054.1 glutamate 5-kinase [Clostridia bacterium]MBQ4249262.1 glutamate 5-kinase [Clostridia bacterium]
MSEINTIVVKVGSSTITHSGGGLDLLHIEKLVRTLSDFQNMGKRVVLVSSGAVAVGVSKLGLDAKPKDTPGKQAAAAVGQCELMFIYDKFFSEYNNTVAQVLLTKDATEDDERRQNVINTLNRLMESRVIPIINENDTVSTEELEFGDNDTLSAIVATLVGADTLVLLTDVDGLYDKNPQKNARARRIPVVLKINDDILSLAGDTQSDVGTGGMITKLRAAEIATSHGIDMYIASGSDPSILYDILDGKSVGTLFVARDPEDDNKE